MFQAKTHILGSSQSPYLLPEISALCSMSGKYVPVSASSLDLAHTLWFEVITYYFNFSIDPNFLPIFPLLLVDFREEITINLAISLLPFTEVSLAKEYL